MITIAAPDRTAPPTYGWGAVLLLHLGPGAVFLAAYLPAAAVAEAVGLPRGTGFAAVAVLVIVPLEVWFLRRAARTETGVASVLGAVDYRSPVRPVVAMAAVAGLLVTGAVIYFGAGGFTEWLDTTVFAWVPESFEVTDVSAGGTVLVAAVLVSLVCDGIVSPVVEELYYRGHLMARLPVRQVWRPVVSAGLFTAAHLWEPHLWPVVFAGQLLNCLVVWKLRNVWIAAAFHVLANSTVTLLTLVG
ncbi:CPBP family intramembrane glutamic endopeptidase [Nocardia thailandica]|uniref:CPBP family intramembrane glutamic endopeptidase n=1 Tax=Nocardia thailandica TaxID=257275 RepID=A0ABW6PP00_9NOCA